MNTHRGWSGEQAVCKRVRGGARTAAAARHLHCLRRWRLAALTPHASCRDAASAAASRWNPKCWRCHAVRVPRRAEAPFHSSSSSVVFMTSPHLTPYLWSGRTGGQHPCSFCLATYHCVCWLSCDCCGMHAGATVGCMQRPQPRTGSRAPLIITNPPIRVSVQPPARARRSRAFALTYDTPHRAQALHARRKRGRSTGSSCRIRKGTREAEHKQLAHDGKRKQLVHGNKGAHLAAR